MTTTTTTTEATTIAAEAAKAVTAKDGKALAALLARCDGLDSLADSKALETRMAAWTARGAVYAAAVVIHAPGTDLHTVPQATISEAVKAVIGIDVDKDTAKKRVRADLYCTPERVAEAAEAFGKADGPASLNAIDVVRWCQARDAKGRAALATRGKAAPTAAEAKAAASLKAAEAKAAKAKADAAKAKDEALTLGRTILAENDDTVHGPLTAARWCALSAEDLDRVAAIVAGLKAAKAEAAKAKARAEREAKAKGQAKGKAKAEAEAEAPAVDIDAIVAAAVAEALAKVGATA